MPQKHKHKGSYIDAPSIYIKLSSLYENKIEVYRADHDVDPIEISYDELPSTISNNSHSIALIIPGDLLSSTIVNAPEKILKKPKSLKYIIEDYITQDISELCYSGSALPGGKRALISWVERSKIIGGLEKIYDYKFYPSYLYREIDLTPPNQWLLYLRNSNSYLVSPDSRHWILTNNEEINKEIFIRAIKQEANYPEHILLDNVSAQQPEDWGFNGSFKLYKWYWFKIAPRPNAVNWLKDSTVSYIYKRALLSRMPALEYKLRVISLSLIFLLAINSIFALSEYYHGARLSYELQDVLNTKFHNYSSSINPESLILESIRNSIHNKGWFDDGDFMPMLTVISQGMIINHIPKPKTILYVSSKIIMEFYDRINISKLDAFRAYLKAHNIMSEINIKGIGTKISIYVSGL